MNFPFDIVGFDLDGTLLDTAEDLRGALNHALELAGRASIAPAAARRLIGGGTRQMLARGLELTGGPLPDQEMEQLLAALVVHYEAHIAIHTRLFPGGEAMLDALAIRHVRLAVVTNKLEHLARKLLDALGLAERFFTIIGGDTLGPGHAKPRPDLLHEMVTRARLSGGEESAGAGTGILRAAYVGDTSFDTEAARAAAMPCVAVSFGFNDSPAATLGADAVIDHYNELIPVLARL